jgi:Phage protein Gp138 N-terminal domain/GpV Apex motif
MDYRERYNNPEEMLRMVAEGHASGMWTAMPGIIGSVDLAAHTVAVTPAVQAVKYAPDDTKQMVNMPLIPDVPIVWPRGGGYTLTFPIAVGDECLIVFAARNIDGWWSQGGIRPPLDARMHDMSDAFCVPGPYSQATKIGGVSTTNCQLRSNDGTVFVELNGAGGIVRIVAPTQITLDAPIVMATGLVRATGNVTAGFGGGDSVGLQTHDHGGVQTGSGNTGAPVAGT